MSAHSGKILVIRGGAIGDFILTLPAIAALRRHFPRAFLEVLGYPHIVQLAQAGGLVDKASSIEARALASFFARNGELSEDLAYYFSEFDLIVSYLYDPDEIFRANITRCSPAQFISCPHRPNEQARIPAAQSYLKPLERLAIFDADPVPRLHFPVSAHALTSPQSAVTTTTAPESPATDPRLALHPGSGGERKNWPEDRWAEFLQKLVDGTRFKLLLVGGEAEAERLQRLAAALPPARTRVAQSLPLTELARLLARCQGFIGHDSGISHLAAALGLPLLVLWGPTDEAVWRPSGDKVVLRRHPTGLNSLPVHTVYQDVQQLWGPT